MNTSEDNKLEILLHRLKRVELKLDEATEILEKFCEDHIGTDISEYPMFLSHVQKESLATQEWTQCFDSIIGYRPKTYEDLKFKVLALLGYMKSGDVGPQILDTVRNDLEKFKDVAPENLLIDTSTEDNIKLKFLLIDDSQVDRMLIKKALKKAKADLEFLELENGTNAVDVIKLNKPSATLLDIRMPGIDGYDVLKLIRDDEELKDHPVWMLSTSSADRDITTALETGANGYYSKPTSMAEYSSLAVNILESATA